MTFRQSTIPILFGSSRPGYPSKRPGSDSVTAWIAEAKRLGIVRVCCLLDDAQLAYYSPSLIDAYRTAFGEENVLHSPIEDYTSCPPDQMKSEILPFVMGAIRAGVPIVVHCSAGMGRTGQVLEAAAAAWQR